MRSRALVGATLALALTATLAPAAPAVATTAPGATACPSTSVPATTFTDTLGSAHRSAIDCAAWWELVEGRSTTSFAPDGDVTRGQTAAMVARLLRTTGAATDTEPSAGFDDTTGHLFEADIALLAATGIVTGVTPDTFAPDAPISRAQMASILSRTLHLGFGLTLPAGSVPFADVPAENVHRDAIGQLVGAGVVAGTSATTYAPGRDVSRAQMASFLTRMTGVLVADGQVGLPEARPGADDAYASRMRATWVHLFDDTLKTRAGIDRMVDEVARADGNTIVAQVIRRHDAYYDSDVLPRTPDPRVAVSFDVLDELLDAAHARGLEVHAWFSVAPTTHRVYDDLPAPTGWVASEHGRDAPDAQKWVTRTSAGTWSDYLDPGVPAVRQHVLDVVTEIAERYPVDGIHLDYVRYSSAESGYNPRALETYRQETGATGTPSPNDPAWSAWRRDQTRRIIAESRSAIDAVDPDIALSAAVITWGDGPATTNHAGFRDTSPYTRTLQDWHGWVRDGLLDAVMPMNYFQVHAAGSVSAADAQLRQRWFDRWIAYEVALAASAEVQVVPGPGAYLNLPDNVLRQVRDAMQADGAAVYSYHLPAVDGSREVWQQLADRRWGYHPAR